MSWILSAFADEAGKPVEDQVQALDDSQLNYIDLRNVGDHNISELPIDQARDVRRQLDAAQKKVCMFGSPIGKIDLADDFNIDLNRLEHLAKLADIFDCRQVRIFSYFNNEAARTPEQWQSESLDRLGQLARRAREMGLVLFHENEKHIFGDKIQQVKAIADTLRDGETFRLIFDFDNYNQTGDDVWANWELLRDQTDAFHLKDSDANNMHVPIGQGAGRAREILADALARGWAGPLSLEPHLHRSPAVMATGPSGQANQALAEMTATEVFQLAAQEAHTLLREIGATYE